MNRQEILAYYRGNPDISVLVIGAGINGIGTFRDLALQGVDVLLVDRADFGSGASMASSHMLHGGIRYLENGEFRLVREALTERNLMLKNAPHYAKPLPTAIPIFRWFSGLFNAPLKFLGLKDKPAERGGIVIKLGLILYDIFASRYRVMPTHKLRLRGSALKVFPKMNHNIVCTATYYDSWMPTPERICIDLIDDTEKLSESAHALNYVSAIEGVDGKVVLRDELTGDTIEVRPTLVVNAGGPWIDFINRALGKDTRFIGGTKGSHLVVDNPDLYEAINGHEVFFENADGRIVLLLPFMGKVMIGTTDIRIEDPDDAVTTQDEIDYFITMCQRVFPSVTVDPSQIVFHFSGVRPLPASEKSFTGNVSRDHSIRIVEAGDSSLGYPVLSLIGGKWTTFRAFAEQTTDAVLERLGRVRHDTTVNMAIGGGKDYPQTESAQARWIEEISQRFGLETSRVKTLFDRYGTRAKELAAFIVAGEDQPITGLESYTRREISHLIHREKAVHIDDIVLRRSLIAWLGQLNDEAFNDLADIMAEELGWSDEQKVIAMTRAAEILNARHGIQIQMPVK